MPLTLLPLSVPLSVLIFLLTRLLVSAYAALHFTRILPDLLSFIFSFSWRVSSIACHVSGVTHSSFFSSSPLGRFYLLHQRCFSLAPTVDLQFLLLYCLAHLCYSRLGTSSSAVGHTTIALVLTSCSLLMSYLVVVCSCAPAALSFTSHLSLQSQDSDRCLHQPLFSLLRQAGSGVTCC